MSVKWTGLAEHMREIEQLPHTVVAMADARASSAAEATAAALRAAYPVVTGHLRDSVTIERHTSGGTVSVSVINTAEYAIPFEYGGAERPAGKVFVPITARGRRQTFGAIVGGLRELGATVRTV